MSLAVELGCWVYVLLVFDLGFWLVFVYVLGKLLLGLPVGFCGVFICMGLCVFAL